MGDKQGVFWTVWGPEALPSPQRYYDNPEEAQEEARALAARRPGHKCYVLESKGYMQTKRADWFPQAPAEGPEMAYVLRQAGHDLVLYSQRESDFIDLFSFWRGFRATKFGAGRVAEGIDLAGPLSFPRIIHAHGEALVGTPRLYEMTLEPLENNPAEDVLF